MSKNILIIGYYSAEGVDSFSWWQELPNLSDYDTVILDTTKIYTYWALGGRLKDSVYYDYSISNINEQDERIASNLELVKRKLLEIIEFDVSIFAIYSPNISVQYDDPSYEGDVSDIGTNQWCPISIDVVREKGKTIQVTDNSYEDYFRYFKGWEYYFSTDTLDIDELEKYYKWKWKVFIGLDPIATNKVKKPIAVKFTPRLYPWEDKNHTSWNARMPRWGGSLTLLPTNDIYHTSDLIEILLQKGKEFKETPQPTWVNKIEIPGEASIKTEVSNERKKLEEQAHRVNELEASQVEIEKYKRLLYADGPELQEICELALQSIGAKTRPSPVSDEFIVSVDGEEALVEVKGSINNINKKHIGQLITDFGQLVMETDEPNVSKRILIGNAWRRSPPEERGTKEQPLFTRDVVKIAKTQNVILLPTVELFKAYCRVKEEPKLGPEILNKIIDSKGIIKF